MLTSCSTSSTVWLKLQRRRRKLLQRYSPRYSCLLVLFLAFSFAASSGGLSAAVWAPAAVTDARTGHCHSSSVCFLLFFFSVTQFFVFRNFWAFTVIVVFAFRLVVLAASVASACTRPNYPSVFACLAYLCSMCLLVFFEWAVQEATAWIFEATSDMLL